MSDLRQSILEKLRTGFNEETIHQDDHGFRTHQRNLNLHQLKVLVEVSQLGNFEVNVKRSGQGVTVIIG